MPTTIREQLLVGIHQTERVVSKIKDPAAKAAFSAELDAYLEQVRGMSETDEAEVRRLFPLLQPLHQRIVEAAK